MAFDRLPLRHSWERDHSTAQEAPQSSASPQSIEPEVPRGEEPEGQAPVRRRRFYHRWRWIEWVAAVWVTYVLITVVLTNPNRDDGTTIIALCIFLIPTRDRPRASACPR